MPAITNSHFLAEIIITNIGTIAIEPTSGRKPFYVLSVETDAGWIDATPPAFTTIYMPFRPGESKKIRVPLPGNALKWKVGIVYWKARTKLGYYLEWGARSFLPWSLSRRFERPVEEIWGEEWIVTRER